MSSSSVMDDEEMDLETAFALSRSHHCPLPRRTKPSQQAHAGETESLVDIALPQVPIAPSSSPPSQISYRLPDELILKIIDLFVPRTGICISNDPERDVYLLTIRSLLQTCYRVKREILSRTFGNPLHVYITNGNRCRCQNLKEAKDIFKTPLGKVLGMPLALWSEVVISFVPAVHQPPRQACVLEVQNMLRTLPKGTEPTLHEMRCAMACITRQSNAVGKIMENRAYVRKHQYNIRFRFRFDGSRGC